MAAVFWLEMMDAGGKLALTALWLVIAALLCAAFFLNDGAPVLALAVLVFAFGSGFILAMIQMFVNPSGPSRLFFTLLAGGWAMTGVLFVFEWLEVDPFQMKGWLLACLVIAASCIGATWWEEMRWRRCVALWFATILLWGFFGPLGIVNDWLNRGEVWVKTEGFLEVPFFLEHEGVDHLIVGNFAMFAGEDSHHSLESYRDRRLVRRVAMHEDGGLASISASWGGHFAWAETASVYSAGANVPTESWVQVYDAALNMKHRIELPPMSRAFLMHRPRFLFGDSRTPWCVIPLLHDDPEDPQAVTMANRQPAIMLWNSETGEERNYEGFVGGHVGGWVGDGLLAHLRVHRRHTDDDPAWISLETLDIHTGAVTEGPKMTFDDHVMLHLQYRDRLSYLRVGGDLLRVDWSDDSVHRLGKNRDGNAFHFLETTDGVRVAFSTDPDEDGRQSLNMVLEDGTRLMREGLREYVGDPWISPDGRRVLFTQSIRIGPPIDDFLAASALRIRVWNVEPNRVQTIHHRGLNDAPLIPLGAPLRMHPHCSPWTSDSKGVAIVQHRRHWNWLPTWAVLLVVEVE